MKVSIIIPVYNGHDFLERCLDSVINQIYKNIEIIIVDDASTDDTKEIIKKYSEKDKRIIPFYQSKNKGVSAARNTGLKAATGDYIVFLDSDDTITKEAIRRMIDLANKYNSDFIDSYHVLEYTKKNGKTVSFTEKKVPKKVLILGTINDNDKILDMATYMTGKLIKKKLLDGLKFDEDLKCYEDMALEHELKTRVKNYVFMNRCIYRYYQRSDSLVNTLGLNHLCFIDASKKVKEVYKNYDKNIKDKIEALLVSNMFLTCLTKITKNDKSLEENTEISKQFLIDITKVFPNYKDNSKISKFIKKNIDKFINNDQKLSKFIKKTKKINFIMLYFTFLSIINKYKVKNRLEN